MRVWLQYPWKFPDSPYYKYLIGSPPEGTEYVNLKSQKGAITSKTKFYILTRLKVNIRKYLNKLNVPFPNAHLTKSNEKIDLIHCAHCLSKNKDVPWVADMESVWSMWVSGMNTKRGIRKVKKILLRPNCKKILPWTEKTKKEIIAKFPELEKKVELVYPAVPFKEKSDPSNEKLILFAGRDFRLKGGIIALETMRIIKKKMPECRCVFISSFDETLKKRFPEIEMYNLIPQEKLFDFMKNASIFLYPSLMDTFGFSILESMSFGVPVVALNTVNTKSVREIIDDGKTGIVIDTDVSIINRTEESEKKLSEVLAKKTLDLISRKNEIGKMSLECEKVIKQGKFSIKEQNSKLKRIYEEAIK